MLPNLITFGAFLFIAAMVYLIARRLVMGQKETLDRRLAPVEVGDIARRTRSMVSDAITESLSRQIPQLDGDTAAIDQELRRAGFYQPNARQDFLALRNVLVIVVLIMTGILATIAGPRRQNVVIWYLIFGMVIAGLCWALPRIYLKVRGARRVQKIRRALPDSLDMLSMCLTGGLSMHDALAHVSREVYFAHRDLATEMLIIRRQADMTSFELAFGQFAKRIDAPEVRALSTLIAQNQRLGTDVVTSVRDFADGLRLKWRQANDERAAKASVKMLFPLVLCLLPSIFILLWGPAIADLIQFLRGYDENFPLFGL